jgi:hypothetical protein
MLRRDCAAALAAAVLFVFAASLDADVRTEEKTLVKFEGMLGRVVNLFGGKAAREGVTSTVAVKGDRKATTTGSTGQIVDLAEEKIYDLDIRRKTYRVTTFAELRRRMEEARRKAEADAREQSREQGQEPPADQPEKELEVDFDVKETGQRKAINGFDTRQFVATVTLREKGKTLEQSGGLVLTADTWLAPTIASMKEVAAFDMRYAQQLQGPMFAGASPEEIAAALAMYPGLSEGLARMRAEGGKMDGTPILTTLTVEAVKSPEQLAEEQKQAEASKPSNARSIGGLVGGLARRAARKDDDTPKPRATFMTTTNEVLKVTTSVADGDVALPAGFKEVR